MNNNKFYSDSINGFNYDVIMPENVTSDTKIIVYSTSTDDTWNGYTDLKNEILNNDMDAIIVIPTNGWMTNDDYSAGVISAVNKVKDDYDIEYDGYIGSGFSNPSINAVKTFAKYIDENPNCDRQVLFLNDAVPQTAVKDASGNYHWYDTAITDAEIATLEKNGTFVVDYCRPGTFSNVGDRLLNSNVDILFICDDNLPSGSWNTQHSYINNKAYSRDGLYSHVMNFIYDDGELPSGYSYYIYDHETKTFNKYTDPSLISEVIREKYNFDLANMNNHVTKIDFTNYGKDKLDYIANLDFSKFDGQINSDFNYAHNLVADIMGSIKQYAAILDSGAFSTSFQSTSSIPSKIPILVEKYFKYNVDMIYNLTKVLENIVKAADDYEELDKELAVKAEDITVIDDVKDINDTLDDITTVDDIKGIDNTPIYINPIIDNKEVIQTPSGYTEDIYYKKLRNEFLDYDKMHSDDNRLVYDNKKDKCKVVIHLEKDKITGIEDYYNYDSHEEALKAFKKLNEKYANDKDIYKVIYKDNTVKVIYNKRIFADLTVEKIKDNYATCDEIVMPEVE